MAACRLVLQNVWRSSSRFKACAVSGHYASSALQIRQKIGPQVAPVLTRSFADQQKDISQPKHLVSPSDFDKTVLVKAKMYPSVEDVPDEISASSLKKARDLMRIRVNLYMVGAGVVIFITVAILGNRAKKDGRSLQHETVQWQADLKKKGDEERTKRQE